MSGYIINARSAAFYLLKKLSGLWCSHFSWLLLWYNLMSETVRGIQRNLYHSSLHSHWLRRIIDTYWTGAKMVHWCSLGHCNETLCLVNKIFLFCMMIASTEFSVSVLVWVTLIWFHFKVSVSKKQGKSSQAPARSRVNHLRPIISFENYSLIIIVGS